MTNIDSAKCAPLCYSNLNGVENSEEYRLEGGAGGDDDRSDKICVEVELFNTYSRILSETCPKYEYRSGHLQLYRITSGGTSDNCRACVLVLATVQNVLTHEKRCRLLCTNIEFIMYSICIPVGTTFGGMFGRGMQHLRTICDNKCHLIRNRREFRSHSIRRPRPPLHATFSNHTVMSVK